MTTLAPPPEPPSTARDDQSELVPRGKARPGAVVATVLLALLLTALLNPDDLLQRASRQPFGWKRTVSVRLAKYNRTVSHALWLDRPRRAVDHLLGRPGGAPAPALPPVVAVPPSSPSTTPETTPPVATPSGRPTTKRPTAAAPLRVYIAGDSVAQSFSNAFSRIGDGTGVVRTTIDFRFSTGLTRPDYFNWPARLREVLRRRPPPQAIIVMFGANDIQPIMTPTGAASPGTAAWRGEYRRRVTSTMQLLAGSQIPVYWIGQPLMRSSTFSQRIIEVDDIYAAEAKRFPDIMFIDTRPLLADTRGRYTSSLPDGSGKDRLIRTPDGVHLTEAGGRLLATAVIAALRARWTLP